MFEPANTPAYRLDELGWLQLERFAADVLELRSGLAPDGWSGQSDEVRLALSPDGLPHPLDGSTLPGPAVVLAVWSPPSLASEMARARNLANRILTALTQDPEARAARTVVVLTNLGVGPDLPGPTRAEVLAANELSTLIDAEPELRQLLAPEIARRSTADLPAGGARPRLRLHARLPRGSRRPRPAPLRRAHRAARDGQDAIARMIALTAATLGWEAHDCVRPDELWSTFDPAPAGLRQANQTFLNCQAPRLMPESYGTSPSTFVL